MTEEIKNKIADAVKQYAENNSPKQLVIPAYHDGAHFGYSLASEKLTSAEARIKELEDALGKLYQCCLSSDFNEHWESYLNAGKLLNQ